MRPVELRELLQNPKIGNDTVLKHDLARGNIEDSVSLLRQPDLEEYAEAAYDQSQKILQRLYDLGENEEVIEQWEDAAYLEDMTSDEQIYFTASQVELYLPEFSNEYPVYIAREIISTEDGVNYVNFSAGVKSFEDADLIDAEHASIAYFLPNGCDWADPEVVAWINDGLETISHIALLTSERVVSKR